MASTAVASDAYPGPAVGELLGLLGVTRTIASGADLSDVLDEITRGAASVIGARTASILLLNASDTLELAGSYGLSRNYGTFLRDPATALGPGRGPAGLAIASGGPIAVEDVETDPRFDRWRHIAADEGYRAMLSVPLGVEDRWLGAITIYRDQVGPWSQQDVEVLTFFAAHAASAVFVAQLVAAQGRQLAALSRLVVTLREQTHEHANRLHAIGGLLALGEHAEAQRFVASLESAHHLSYGALVGSVENLALAGLVLAQTAIAEQRGISLKLDARSHLPALPAGLGDAEAVAILGNLLDNALDSVDGMPPSRRRITVALRAGGGRTTFRVRDWGRGVDPAAAERLFERGFTTKGEHFGVGLAIVAEIVSAAGGEIAVTRHHNGTTVTVTIPDRVSTTMDSAPGAPGPVGRTPTRGMSGIQMPSSGG